MTNIQTYSTIEIVKDGKQTRPKKGVKKMNVLEKTKELLLECVDETEIFIQGDDSFVKGQITLNNGSLDINFSYNDVMHKASIRIIYNTANFDFDAWIWDTTSFTDYYAFLDGLIGVLADYNNYNEKGFIIKILLDL